MRDFKLLFALLTGLSVTHQVSAAEGDSGELEAPGVYIERTIDSSGALVPALRGQYQICVEKRLVYKRSYEKGDISWAILSSKIPEGYDVQADPLPEPDWKKESVGIEREKEYFQGDKYAKYTYKTKYEFSEIDRCAIRKYESVRIELDTGRERFLVLLEEKIDPSALPSAQKIPLSMQYKQHHVERLISPVLLRRENDAVLAEIGKDERIAKLLSLLYADTKTNRAPGVNVAFDPKAVDNFKELVGYREDNLGQGELPRANDEHYVLGHGCDIISAENFHGRIWYWAQMHHYPSIMERPVLLKSEVTSASKKLLAVEEATAFRVLHRIDDAVFELEPGLRQGRTPAKAPPH